jgi:hypothetical protein
VADSYQSILETLRTTNPEYRGVDDGKLLAALVHTHPSYAQAIGDEGLRLALRAGHTPRTAGPPRPTGMLKPGTLNLNGRPIIPTPGMPGHHSSEISFSQGTDEGEVLVPLIVNGKALSQKQAWQHYLNTGQHMGIFDTPAHADAYAEQVHQRPPKSNPNPPVYVYPVEQDTPMQLPTLNDTMGQS